MGILLENRGEELPERCEVVQDPEATPVGREHEVAEAWLHRNTVNRRGREVVLQGLPFLAVVEGDKEAILESQIQEPTSRWILTQHVAVGEGGSRQSCRDLLP